MFLLVSSLGSLGSPVWSPLCRPLCPLPESPPSPSVASKVAADQSGFFWGGWSLGMVKCKKFSFSKHMCLDWRKFQCNSGWCHVWCSKELSDPKTISSAKSHLHSHLLHLFLRSAQTEPHPEERHPIMIVMICKGWTEAYLQEKYHGITQSNKNKTKDAEPPNLSWPAEKCHPPTKTHASGRRQLQVSNMANQPSLDWGPQSCGSKINYSYLQVSMIGEILRFGCQVSWRPNQLWL